MKDQVLSIEQMQELIKLGIDVSKASMYWHHNIKDRQGKDISKDTIPYLSLEMHPSDILQELGIEVNVIPTFTIHDILDMLPNTIDWKEKTYWFSVFINSLGNKMIGYRDSLLWALEFNYFNINGAFQMLKWCKQNNYI